MVVAASPKLALPRIHLVPPSVSSRADEAIDIAGRAGLDLDDHQRLILQGSSGVMGNGKWAAFEAAVCEPRQNGKDAVLEARELAGLYAWDERLIIHSAHEASTSLEHFRRLMYLIEDTPEFDQKVRRVSRSHGDEGIELMNGCRIRFRTRTKGGGRGFSCDTLVLNEAMILREDSHSALLPTLRARPNPQIWYAGSAVDQEVHEHGLVFTRVRCRAIEGGASLAYFEWSLDYDHPAAIPQEEFADPENWRKTNPAYEIRIFPEHFEKELEAMSRRGFAVEILGVGDWPDPTGSDDMVITAEQWGACEQPDSVLVDPVRLAFDVSPERLTAIAAAGKNSDGMWHVEVLEKLPGTKRLAERLLELEAAHAPLEIVCDGYGPASSVLPDLEAAGVQVTKLDTKQYADACGRLVDVVGEESLRHLGSLDLWNAIRGAKTRPMSDRWAWSRKNSTVNISPLVAATLALWAAMADPDDGGEVHIY